MREGSRRLKADLDLGGVRLCTNKKIFVTRSLCPSSRKVFFRRNYSKTALLFYNPASGTEEDTTVRCRVRARYKNSVILSKVFKLSD